MMTETACNMDTVSRRLTLASLPKRMVIRNLELDVTSDCNLRCIYCYKKNHYPVYLSLQTAMDAIVWFIYASGHAKNLGVYCMGGEPLLQFELFKKLIPFAIRRAGEHGKKLKFSVTTNCTLVNDEVLDFFKKWKVGFHTSIDGVPEVQNNNRPVCGGDASSPKVESVIPSILAYSPSTCARATILPDNAAHMFDSYVYFRSLGYTSIAMLPGEPRLWDETSLQKYETELQKIADHWKDEIRKGIHISCHAFAGAFQGRYREKRSKHSCGAGRGMVSIDSFGNIWPCNRWDAHFDEDWQNWKLGNIYEHFSEETRSFFLQGTEPENRCEQCIAKIICNGGCHASNLDTTGQIDRNHEIDCKLLRIHAKVSIPLHDELYEEHCPAFMEHYHTPEWRKMNPSTNNTANESCII
jgi:uncharacterized protein